MRNGNFCFRKHNCSQTTENRCQLFANGCWKTKHFMTFTLPQQSCFQFQRKINWSNYQQPLSKCGVLYFGVFLYTLSSCDLTVPYTLILHTIFCKPQTLQQNMGGNMCCCCVQLSIGYVSGLCVLIPLFPDAKTQCLKMNSLTHISI